MALHAADYPAVLILAGPTAVGKSSIALRLAQAWDAEIVSADSRQVYRHLNIGTAKPSSSDQERVAHHLIDILEPSARYSAADFASDAAKALADIDSRGKRAIVVGGTGLYLKALTDGIFKAAPTTPETHNLADQIVSRYGLDGLVGYLSAHDPLTLAQIDRKNQVRVRRAVEYHLQNQESLEAGRKARPGEPAPYRFFSVVLVRPREQLYVRVEDRVDSMLANGWKEEVESLMEEFDFELPAFNSVGYRELQDVVLQHVTYAEARSNVVKQTRRYAKRQTTWYSHQGRWVWMTPDIDITSKITSGFEHFSENKNA